MDHYGFSSQYLQQGFMSLTRGWTTQELLDYYAWVLGD